MAYERIGEYSDTMRKRHAHIDIAKGIAIMLIVYGHAITQMKGSEYYSGALLIQDRVVFAFSIPLFFMISGALQRVKIDSHGTANHDYYPSVTKTILLPYFTLSLLFMIMNMVFMRYINAPSIGEMLKAITLYQSNGEMAPSGVLWFLFVLYSYSVVTYFLHREVNMHLHVIVLIGLLLRIIHIWASSPVHLFALDKFMNFYVFYAVGYAARDRVLSAPIKKIRDLSIMALLFGVLVVGPLLFPDNVAVSGLAKAVSASGMAGFLGSIIVLGVSYRVAGKYSRTAALRFVIYCGCTSLAIYVFHMPTFLLMKKVGNVVGLHDVWSSVLLLFVPGVLLPLAYARILALDTRIYRVVLGREPKR